MAAPARNDRAVWLSGEFQTCLHYLPKSLALLPGGGVEGIFVQEAPPTPEASAFEAVVTHVCTYADDSAGSSERFDQQVQIVLGFAKYQAAVLKPVTLPALIRLNAGYLLCEELKVLFATLREPQPQASYEEFQAAISKLQNLSVLCKRAEEKFEGDEVAKLLRNCRDFLSKTLTALEATQGRKRQTPEINPDTIQLLHTAWQAHSNPKMKMPSGVKERDWEQLKKIMGSQSGYYLGVLLDSEACYRFLGMEPDSLSEYVIDPQEVQVNPFVPFDISSFMTEHAGVLPFFRQDPHTCVTFAKLHGLLFELGKIIVVAKSVDVLLASPTTANALLIPSQQLLGLINAGVQALTIRAEQFHTAWKAADKKRQFSSSLCSYLVDRIQSDLQAAGTCLPFIPPDRDDANSLLETFKRHLARILPALTHETEKRTLRSEEQSKADQYVAKARALLGLGQCTEAMQYFQYALELCPADLGFRIAFAEAQELQAYASGRHLRACEEMKFASYAPPINDESLGFIRKHLVTPLCCSCLRVLSLDRNQIGQQGARQLFKDLRSCASLVTLTVSHNMLGDVGAQLLAELLNPTSPKPLLSLELVDMSHTGAANPGAQALANALALNTSLTRLECKGNPLGDEGVAAMAAAIQRNSQTSLSYLGLADTGYGKRSAVQLIMLIEAVRTLDVDVGNLELATHPILTADIWAELKLQLGANREKGRLPSPPATTYTPREVRQLEKVKKLYEKYFGLMDPLFNTETVGDKTQPLYKPTQDDFESSRYLYLISATTNESKERSRASKSSQSRRRSEVEIPRAPKPASQAFVDDIQPFIETMIRTICKFQARRQTQYFLHGCVMLNDPVTLFCEEMKLWLVNIFFPLALTQSAPDLQLGARLLTNGHSEKHRRALYLPFESLLMKTIKARRSYLQAVKEENALESFALENLIDKLRAELEECVKRSQQLWLFETIGAVFNAAIGQGRALVFAVLAHIAQMYFPQAIALSHPAKLSEFRAGLLKLMDEKHDENAVRLYSLLSTPFFALLFPDSGFEALSRKTFEESLLSTRNPHFDGTRVNTKPVVIHTQSADGDKKHTPKDVMEQAVNVTLGAMKESASKTSHLLVGAMKKIVPIPHHNTSTTTTTTTSATTANTPQKQRPQDPEKVEQKQEAGFDTLCLLTHELGQLTFFLIAGVAVCLLNETKIGTKEEKGEI